MAVVVEGVAVGDLAVNAADGEVHLGEPPGRVVRLLTVDRDVGFLSLWGLAAVAVPVGMRVDELDRLHEHARGAAAGIVDATAIGLDHLDQELDHAAWRVEFAALLAFGARELGEKVLVDAAEHVLGAGLLVTDTDVADQIDELAKARLVERGPGVVLGQHALECRVVALDAGHRVVHEPADGGLAGLPFQVPPARLGRHPEDRERAVLVRILGIGALGLLRNEPRVLFLESVGDVLEEDEAEDDVFVLGGIHTATQRVGHAPELGLVADGGAACLTARQVALGLCLRPWLGSRHPILPELRRFPLQPAELVPTEKATPSNLAASTCLLHHPDAPLSASHIHLLRLLE